jgi:hypothetical protein
VKGKIGAALVCLAFALPFGGVGAFAAYAIFASIHDGVRAQDWVRVRAEVLQKEDTYRYTFKDRTYTSARLGVMPFAGTSDVDDFDDRVASLFAQAREEKRPITVYVNPDNPSESMVDRQIRWMLLVFFVPFALAFGGVGVGALWAFARIVRGPARKTSKVRMVEAAAGSAQPSGLAFLWIFALLWNSIAFPIAALALPDIVRREEWIGLLVLLFPLVGIGILWAAIHSTIGRLRRGRATIELHTREPRVGGPVEGHVAFSGSVREGDVFAVGLACKRRFDDGDDATTTSHWNRIVDAKAIAVGGNVRVPFRFEIPRGLPPSSREGNDGARVTHRWHVEVSPAGSRTGPSETIEVEVQPALPGVDAAFAAPPPAQAKAGTDSIEKLFGGLVNAKELTPEQRAAIERLSPQQRAAVAKVVRFAPNLKKVIIAIVALVVAVQVVPLLVSLY